jgi:hypothetical protein
MKQAYLWLTLSSSLLPAFAYEAKAETYICPQSDSKPWVVTLDIAAKTAIIEVPTTTSGRRCIAKYVDGRSAPVIVGPDASYCSLVVLGKNDNARQRVVLSGHQLSISSENEDVRSGFTLDLTTGILRASDGDVSECHLARG